MCFNSTYSYRIAGHVGIALCLGILKKKRTGKRVIKRRRICIFELRGIRVSIFLFYLKHAADVGRHTVVRANKDRSDASASRRNSTQPKDVTRRKSTLTEYRGCIFGANVWADNKARQRAINGFTVIRGKLGFRSTNAVLAVSGIRSSAFPTTTAAAQLEISFPFFPPDLIFGEIYLKLKLWLGIPLFKILGPRN